MEITIFLARFWGSLFMILGALSVGAKFLGRVIEYTDNKTITVSTGYITFLLGLATVVSHNIWTADWRIAITILGWTTLLKGIEKICFPDRVHRKAQMFKSRQVLWGGVIVLIGAWFFWMSF
ncbi:MAG TPA: hypothetical protein DEB30_05405 [Candidatus Peribacter riflensis]|nr:MAG: hypothetical protein A2398_03615 [Candidatus Peribacteria bacterium RIFOXYB1_FULL_57_12]OGJ78775.1 MAG: hypothetical protein A2412_02335 [Candidatus Peribacteria bacterium RIFOXYC1_FULL_58_8]HBH19603.1 hypothetical protein [Candidatus Peribacter riflensis]HBU10197.1 hypothetical protein [Candidatus Peribacter riflensis]